MKLNIQIKTKEEIIKSIYEYTNFDFINNNLFINIKDLYNNIKYGDFDTNIEFINNLVGSYNGLKLFVYTISTSRTEIELKLPSINFRSVSYNTILLQYNTLFSSYPLSYLKTDDNKLKYVYIQFKNLEKYQILNWYKTPDNSVILKLREELSDNIKENDEVIVYEKLYSDTIYPVKLIPLNNELTINCLNKPNFDIDVNEKTVQSEYKNYDDIINNNDILKTDFFNESLKGIQLNIDFTDFSNFVFFSSILERLNNFKYKLQLIENYQYKISLLPITSPDILKYTNIIEGIKQSFDIYEHFLYYENNGIYTYPKDGNNNVLPLSDLDVIAWFTERNEQAKYYDKINYNLLIKLIPNYIYTDVYNVQYLKFINLTAQHFDILWLYINHLEDIKITDSDINKGLSKDLIYYVLGDMSWKPISNFENTNLEDYLYKEEHNDPNQVYASTETVSKKQIDLEVWKRLMDNVIYLYKTKGTKESIRSLLNIYGIPSTSLLIQEYGGKHPYYTNNYFDYDKFTACLDKSTEPTATIIIEDIDTFRGFEIRFKISNSDDNIILNDTLNDIIISTRYSDKSLLLTIGTIVHEINNTDIYNNEWWTVCIGYNSVLSNNTQGIHSFNYIEKIVYSLALVNNKYGKPYNRHSKTLIFTGQNSIIDILNSSFTFEIGSDFTGYLQEIRFWNYFVGYDNVIYHNLAPTTISTCDFNNLYDNLIVRVPLGTDLNTYNHSIITTLDNQNLTRDNTYTITFDNFSDNNNYLQYVEKYYHIVPNISNNHVMNRKIYFDNNDDFSCMYINKQDNGIFSGSFNNSYNNSFLIDYELDNTDINNITELQTDYSNRIQYKTSQNNKLGIYFSPINEVNEDIYDFFGNNNIDEYLGNYIDEYSDNYKYIDKLVTFYEQQYSKKYEIWKYFKMIKQYNKSIFYHLKQLIPLRSTDILGVTIENSLIHRNKITYLNSKPTLKNNYYYFNLENIISNNIIMDYTLYNIQLYVSLVYPNDYQYYKLNNTIVYRPRNYNYTQNIMPVIYNTIFSIVDINNYNTINITRRGNRLVEITMIIPTNENTNIR